MCPACPYGSFALAVEMVQHTIYVCSGCSAALWLLTDEGRRLNTTRADLIARLKRSRI